MRNCFCPKSNSALQPTVYKVKQIAGSEKGAASAPSEDNKARNDGGDPTGEVATAPEDIEPSAPVETIQSAECVVCLERKVALLIL